jgi:hypothetical protein
MVSGRLGRRSHEDLDGGRTRLPVRGIASESGTCPPHVICAVRARKIVNILTRPILANAALLTLRFTLMMMHMNTRFQNLKEMWRAELHRFEGVLDARLNHLEEGA